MRLRRAARLARVIAMAAPLAAPLAVSAQGVVGPMLIPRPETLTTQAGTFVLSDPVRIVVPASSVRLHEIANLLAGVIRARTGFTVRVGTSRTSGSIAIDTMLGSSNPEAYRLTVGADGIAIHGATSAGALWGVQTLRQLLPPDFDDQQGARPARWTIPAVDITDAPRFAWRGSMVDVGRHFFPVATIERHIDVLSRYKMNVFHWHLTDDQGWRIEIRKYPRLTSVGAWRTEADGSRYGGFYTQRQIREVVEYARLRGVTVVPEIEMPGHSSAAIAAYPELGCTGQPVTVPTTWGVFADIYCAGNERTFTFITNVLSEVISLFPSRYIHIGGDEVPKERWTECAACQEVMRREGLTGEDQLQSWFVRRVGTWLAQHNRKLIGWDEVLQGGLMEGATVQAWEDTAFTRSAVQAGHDVIASPQGWTYFNRTPGDLTIDKVVMFDPVPRSLDSTGIRHVLGAEAPLWSENIVSGTNLELMAFPRMLALADNLWSRDPRDTNDLRARLNGDHLARLRPMGVAVGPVDRDIARIRIEYDTVARAARVRTDYGMPGVVVRGTSNGRAPTAKAPAVADSSLVVGQGIHRLQPFYMDAPVLGERDLTVVRNDALGKPVHLSSPPRGQYQGTGPGTLTDGLEGSTDHADGLWQGWLGSDIEASVDLGAVRRIDSVRVNFLGNVRSWIMMPPRVDFALSDDGVTWRPIGTVDSGIPADREGAIIHAFAVTPPAGTRARFVRVTGRYAGPLPAWHPGAGRPSWLFADEIVVR